jgi:hypothetical protein
MEVLKQGSKQDALNQILGEECELEDDSTLVTLNTSQPTIKSKNTF